MDLRPYQVDAFRGVQKSFKRHRSAIVVLPTGTGKTFLFSRISAKAVSKGNRVLILAHTDELIEQAVDKLWRADRIRAAVEKAQRKEGLGSRVVVASVQSMTQDSRLERFARDHFDLTVIDECHRAVAPTYRKVIDHFETSKVLGVTATADRSDEVALGKVFEDDPFTYEINQAVPDGWLVPFSRKEVVIEGLDLSRCRKTAGDLNLKDLGNVMSEVQMLHEVARPTAELAEGRPTIVFAVTVAHAHALAEVIRKYTRAKVEALDGTASNADRKATVGRFRSGETQFLVNCALFTEGFDVPPVALVVHARPTSSRLLYCQMTGRGTRPLDGIVDQFPERDMHVLRRQAIADSGKPNLLVIDFVGNSGKHSLISLHDILDGNATPAQIARAKLKSGEDVLEDLAEARREMIEDARRSLAVDVAYHVLHIDPFMAFGVVAEADRWGRKIDKDQLDIIQAMGIETQGLDRRQAGQLITEGYRRRMEKLCTFKQSNRLLKAGIPSEVVWDMSFDRATELVSVLIANRWKGPPYFKELRK